MKTKIPTTTIVKPMEAIDDLGLKILAPVPGKGIDEYKGAIVPLATPAEGVDKVITIVIVLESSEVP